MALKSVKKNRLPKFYADALQNKPKDYYDYEQLKVKFGNIDEYEVQKKIGRGKYSEVFSGTHVPSKKKVVMKILKPVKRKKIKREIKILQTVAKGPNIVALFDVVLDTVTQVPCFVFEQVNSDNWKTLWPKLTLTDIRYYMFELLKALDYTHSRGVMHRDVKPGNIMIDHDAKKLRLIDWGLAEYYFPLQDYNVRVASRHYKGPELLVDDTVYDYTIDSWSAGCVLAGMTFMKEPFFQGADNVDQLYKIVLVLGTEMLNDYLDTYDLDLDLDISERVANLPRKPWKSFISDKNKERSCPESLELIDQFLRYEPAARILPTEAMQHKFFEPLRSKSK
mmetsp:Transcript_75589/g.138174  ORF Transcript_75589/g.138174 Transcript_75589/m.138174 type:complete len:336 (+) Transcript_75589:79-1086(+)